MEDRPETGPQGQPAGRAEAAEAWRAVPEKPVGENAFLKLVQRPRIMLVLLAVWSILGVLTEIFTGAGLFVEPHNGGGNLELDGALGGFALGWQGIPLAALYLYCARNPVRFQGIFWLALIHMASLIAADLYHWVRSTYSAESILMPVIGSGALGMLVFVHIFRPRPEEEKM